MAVDAASPWALDLGQIGAILQAQFRGHWNFFRRRGKAMGIFNGISAGVIYCFVILGAIMGGFYCRRAAPEDLNQALSMGALFLLLYWQVVPLMLASTGVGLDLKKLVCYPLSGTQLFALDLLLRLTTGVEAMIVMAFASIGLWLNPALRWWAPLILPLFALFNMCLASGTRALVGRWMTGRRTREVTMLFIALTAALPQVLLTRRQVVGEGTPTNPWAPWSAVGDWASGIAEPNGAALLLFWTTVAWAFGWWQFQRSLRFDDVAAQARPTKPGRARFPLAAWVGSLWQDPIGALVEKELRALVRTPRFRVVFIMGFSFSLVILVPMLARHGTGPDYLLLLIFGYSMLLLGECCFWNVLGFDRGAAQLYFLVPRPFRQVLMAKNMVAALVVLAEFLCISTVALVFRLNFTGVQWLEAMAAGSVMALELVAAGNLASVHMPRAADPANVWRSGAAGRTQGLVTLMLPAVAAPIALAYLARYAFDTNLAFWGVLALVAALAGVFYWVSLDSAVKAAGRKKEDITAALSTGANPINS